ncbi:MAG: polysaccharide deacetylase family protein [Acutalibacteraceae bacterium]|nr:polysaccharide deacetylase family protein [Acutalibacteraceae bacterium]
MKKCLIVFMVLSMMLCFTSCKEETKQENAKKPTINTPSGMTYTEYLEYEKKLEQERQEKIVNAQWKEHPEDYKIIAFTFDDAPSYSTTNYNHTVTIIEALNKYEGAGTLFINGKQLENNGNGLLHYAVQRGFELGNHTYSHAYLDKISKNEVVEEVTKVNEMVEQQLGIKLKYLRPGYLVVNENVFEVSKELDMPIIHCSKNISTKDYDALSTAESVKSTILNNAYDGAIVLCHGWCAPTAECIEEVCASLYERGYRFATLSELFEFRGNGKVPTGQVICDAKY